VIVRQRHLLSPGVLRAGPSTSTQRAHGTPVSLDDLEAMSTPVLRVYLLFMDTIPGGFHPRAARGEGMV